MSPYFRGGDPRARARTRWSSPLRPHAQECFRSGPNLNIVPLDTLKLIHQDLGYIKGTASKPGVVQFLGVQYAVLDDPFAPPELKLYDKNAITKATKLGPIALPDVSDGNPEQESTIQETLDITVPDLTYSETECLNLNITVPLANDLKYLPDDRKLPVLVFVHGGGFMTGSANWPQYDLAHIANMGASRGRPFIAVGINYRPGSTGVSSLDKSRDAASLPNDGLRDQRTALLWIKQYITGFGGDADNITLAGHSAGAASVFHHMRSKEPLFRRAIFMSGLGLAVRPLTQEEANVHHDAATSRSSLALDAPARRNQARLSGDIDPTSRPQSPSEQECETVPAVSMSPGIDSDSLLTPQDIHTRIDSPAPEWCESIMIGDCMFHGQVYSLQLAAHKRGIGKRFRQTVFETLEHEDANCLLSCYDLHKPTDDDDEALYMILCFLTDITVFAPTVHHASTFISEGIKTYVYRFNELKPSDGPWKAYSTHALDITFLLQNLNQHLEGSQRQLAQHFAEDVLAFVCGDSPWRPQQDGAEQLARVYGPMGRIEDVPDVPEQVGRRNLILDLAETVSGGMDKLRSVADAFLLASQHRT